MSIVIDQQKKVFTIHTKSSTYQMTVGAYNQLLHLYYGKRLAGEMDLNYLLPFYDRGFSGNPYDAGEDRTYSMDTLPQEYPCHGTGDYRSTALQIGDAQGIYGCDLRYQSARITDGKYSLPQLPHAHTEGAAQTLEIVLADSVTGVEVTLYYGVLEDCDVITRAARIRNNGTSTVTIEKAASCCLDFLYGDYDLIHFHGRHGMER
jgi:alpha-galactosidase